MPSRIPRGYFFGYFLLVGHDRKQSSFAFQLGVIQQHARIINKSFFLVREEVCVWVPFRRFACELEPGACPFVFFPGWLPGGEVACHSNDKGIVSLTSQPSLGTMIT